MKNWKLFFRPWHHGSNQGGDWSVIQAMTLQGRAWHHSLICFYHTWCLYSWFWLVFHTIIQLFCLLFVVSGAPTVLFGVPSSYLNYIYVIVITPGTRRFHYYHTEEANEMFLTCLRIKEKQIWNNSEQAVYNSLIVTL